MGRARKYATVREARQAASAASWHGLTDEQRAARTAKARGLIRNPGRKPKSAGATPQVHASPRATTTPSPIPEHQPEPESTTMQDTVYAPLDDVA